MGNPSSPDQPYDGEQRKVTGCRLRRSLNAAATRASGNPSGFGKSKSVWSAPSPSREDGALPRRCAMFESALVETGRRQSARRWLSLPVAVAFHLVVVAGVCIAQYAQVDRLADPDENVVFFVPAPLPDLEPRIATGASRPVDKPA